MGSSKKRINSGNFWTIGIGLGLFIWGLLSLLDERLNWAINIRGSPWLMFAGGFMLLIGISNIFTYRYNREKVLSALRSYPRVGLTQLAYELKMKDKDVKDIIVDLRTEGLLKASFDPKSGDVMVLDVKGQTPIATSISPFTDSVVQIDSNKTTSKAYQDQVYCQYCGSFTKLGDKFCNNCGSALE